jgi:hypothetical protein
MDSRLKHLERKQKLYSMLKVQHDAEIKELMHYMSILPTIDNNLVRSYVHTLLTDGLRHIEYISRIIADIEGATGSASLTNKYHIIHCLNAQKWQMIQKLPHC